MKRSILFITTIFLVCLLLLGYKILNLNSEQISIDRFNNTFLEYNKEKVYGLDVTTVINKAMNNNKNKKIKQDNEAGEFIPDDLYSIKIYVNFEDGGPVYPMENLYNVGIEDFTSYFGELYFKCTKVNYHENGRISEMYFSAINYSDNKEE